jgi:hypothetical protein
VRIKSAIVVVIALAGIVGCASNPYSAFDDPRPEGRLSLREHSQCETPDDPEARWCDYPHEIRAFTEKREACDHFRGEPWPEGDTEGWERERRKQLIDGMRKHCAGTDRELMRLRAKYRDDADVSKALAAFEDRIE